MSRTRDINCFYEILGNLETKLSSNRMLSECDGKMDWFDQGVYFFFEKGETRDNINLRVVRVGTHAVSQGSRTTLWSRLKAHKGIRNLSGNHRGSVFRKLIGYSLIERDKLNFPHWGEGINADKEIRLSEIDLERRVSTYIGNMPFLWLKAEDEASKDSIRSYIEVNSIALLSNYEKDPIDIKSSTWLGNHSGYEKIINSGLWNSDHVDKKTYHPSFLNKLNELVKEL